MGIRQDLDFAFRELGLRSQATSNKNSLVGWKIHHIQNAQSHRDNAIDYFSEIEEEQTKIPFNSDNGQNLNYSKS
jgi:hypothetical protein